MTPEDDNLLLRALHQVVGQRPFDGATIEFAMCDAAWPKINGGPRLNAVKTTELFEAVEKSALYAAMKPIDPKLYRGRVRLHRAARQRLDRWLQQLVGRSIGRLVLSCDEYGWYRLLPT